MWSFVVFVIVWWSFPPGNAFLLFAGRYAA